MNVNKTRYVCGFAFDSVFKDRVVLIQKNRPEWQAGKLNGVGGKIEEFDLHPLNAMIREFKEETGVDITDWNIFCEYESKDFIVYFFVTFTELMYDVKSITDEQIKILSINDTYFSDTLPNLKWLIPLALDYSRDKKFTKIEDLK